MKFTATFPVFFALILCACNGSKPAPYNPAALVMSGNKTTDLQAGRMLGDYYALKDGLVATDADRSVKAALAMKASATALRQHLVASVAYAKDSNVVLAGTVKTDSIITQLDRIITARTADCERMRIAFRDLSDLTYGFLKGSSAKHIQAYHYFCPMALNEKGARWLSASPETENPYFGEKMLTCGELVDTIH